VLVICDNCYHIEENRIGAYCPKCLKTGHWFQMLSELMLLRGIDIYESCNIPTQMKNNAIARKQKAIELLKEANES